MESPPRLTPWVQLRAAAHFTFCYRKMFKGASPDTRPGNCVAVYDKHDALVGWGLFNPQSNIVVRMLTHDGSPADDAFWKATTERAVGFRMRTLDLPATTDAYRLVHAEGDGLSGLIVDRYQDVLAVEVFSLGMWRLVDTWLPLLHAAAGTTHHRVSMDENVQRLEGFSAETLCSDGLRDSVTITENGVRFRVSFATGHKTGFFCDQRDNRLRLAGMVRDATVLDLCSYSGGFGIYAKARGQAKEVTCVDLDETAIAQAQKNANLNQVRVQTVHSDAFTYMRQMQENGRRYGAVVLDPPKLVFGRGEGDVGRHKYADFNRLAAGLIEPGGLLLTCSCSGALEREEFIKIVIGAIRHAGRECQILDITGPGMDHPVSTRCAESAYLKAVWLRLL